MDRKSHLDFAPLVRLAGLPWDEVTDVMTAYSRYPVAPLRPTLKDYAHLDRDFFCPLLANFAFQPSLFVLNASHEELSVHLGAARIVADTLGLDFSEACLDTLIEEAMVIAEKRGIAARGRSAVIDNLRARVKLLSKILTDFEEYHDALDENSVLFDREDSRNAYNEYAYSLPRGEPVMTRQEFTEMIVCSGLNVIREVLTIERDLASLQYYGARRSDLNS